MPEASGTPLLIALAHAMAPHALPAFLLVLLTAVTAGGLACGWLQRRHAALEAETEARPPRLVLSLALGFAAVVAAAALFAGIAERATPTHTLGRADQVLADGIAATLPWAALRAFSVLTHLGDRAVLIAIGVGMAAWLLWRRHTGLALGWMLALGGNAVLNPTLKNLFERARPVHDHGLALEDGYSFPSGHSSGSMVVYGMLLYVALQLLPPRWHAPAVMAAIAVILTTACSRIFLQVHFASDVAAGLLSGGTWLAVCIASLAWAQGRTRARPAT
ncbi:phosphatase PAP2 family protein [Variovorax arabinosiphilus]|uniref:phosphatase PAP2 family protein n=1 Tax=Variovorax arabinosiphilus TaxID=3053498 RepID=UPI002574ED01|nr:MULTISPECIES: phosphatase PAP2 family protein [unclassified Variovorax]MDM0120892.1 phosphatase PAP2 family protein [Variovorax sp. J2L1-78]MDM0129953.1 phosphatase PAP2 family protein [Variovorax sp. J2L1-63]MDM0233655.1 phosphatase PAP2 family protein [Variovorax sp. J2R1-6]